VIAIGIDRTRVKQIQSGQPTGNVIRALERDGKLDITGAPGRPGYLLKPEART